MQNNIRTKSSIPRAPMEPCGCPSSDEVAARGPENENTRKRGENAVRTSSMGCSITNFEDVVRRLYNLPFLISRSLLSSSFLQDGKKARESLYLQRSWVRGRSATSISPERQFITAKSRIERQQVRPHRFMIQIMRWVQGECAKRGEWMRQTGQHCSAAAQ